MPLPKRQAIPLKSKKSEPPKSQKSADSTKLKKASNSTKTPADDSRFANFQSDAKYRLPAKKHSTKELDDRFSRLLTDPDFYSKASVDKYGRKISKEAGKKEIARLYNAKLEEDSSEDEDEDEELNTKSAKKMDRKVKREMAKVDIRGNGPAVDSSSDESSSDEEDEDVEVEEEAELAQPGSEIPEGEVTARLAAVNMDWDNIRAKDIFAVAESFLPPGGSIRSVIIYPSEFGMERMQREEIEGPPREIFASSSSKNKSNINSLDDMVAPADSDDEDHQKDDDVPEGEEFDSKALRKYQLDRLRYYYAIVTFSTPDAAKAVYDNLDGREYLSSANFFDLRFVPDDTTFDTDPHDECERLPEGYKPNEFSTDALTHSKVKLTWDAEDNQRKEAQKRAFSRKEVDEMELQAYIGSDSDEEEDVAQPDKAAALRAALGLDSADAAAKPKPGASKRDRDFKKPEGEMEVTFSAGLSANASKGSVFENEPITDETTLEKYVRKQKERKQRRKERAKAIAEGPDPDALAQTAATTTAADDDDPWNDPFFAADPDAAKPKASDKKAAKAAKKAEKEAEEAAKATERANLELLMVDDEDARMRHFDMNEILKAEKAKKKNKKNKKGDSVAANTDDDFKIDTADPRFAKLYESHEFAIDPTNPRFKETKGMKALLEEGRKKRKHDRDDGVEVQKKKKSKKADEVVADGGDDLKKLAARVKAKSKMV